MGKYIAIFSLIAFVIIALCFYSYLAFGCYYTGKEFSPDDFTIRRFTYRYEAITGKVLSGRTFTIDKGGWLPNLVADKLVTPVNKKEQTWHLIARFLIDFLSLKNESLENTWTAWNSENPKLAKVLWPLIAEMARDKMYIVLGDVFSFVLNADVSKPNEFQADLQQEVAKAYLKMGKFDFENNKLKSAKVRISKSIKYDSTEEARVLSKRVDSLITNSDAPVLEAIPE